MRTIEPTGRFRRDLRRELKGRYRLVIAGELDDLITLLATDAPIPDRHRDHALTGDWIDHRDCHVRPDLVLIYRKADATTLQLVRLGSHAELVGDRPELPAPQNRPVTCTPYSRGSAGM